MAVLDVALSSHVDLMTLAVLILEMVVATWAIFNLYRLVKRRRSFLPSMVAFLAFNASFTVLLNIEQCFSDPATQAEALATMALSVVLAGLWISYLLLEARSRGIRQVASFAGSLPIDCPAVCPAARSRDWQPESSFSAVSGNWLHRRQRALRAAGREKCVRIACDTSLSLIRTSGRSFPMRKAATNPNRLEAWSDSLANKLPSKSRKQRKRLASKRRRTLLRREDLFEE